MSEAIKKVHEGKKISAEDIKELVDSYNITQVIVSDSNNDEKVNLYTNRCELFDNKIVFYQSGSFGGTNSIVFKQNDMSNVTWKEGEASDFLILKSALPENKKLCIVFMNQYDDDEVEGWHEIDLDNMKTFMDEALDGKNGYQLATANMSDCFSMSLNFYSCKAFIDDLDEEEPKLRINDSLELFVFDDGCNEFQVKETDTIRCFRIQPYGQPFTTVKLVYVKMPSK